MQFYLELLALPSNDLIDRFAINLSVPVNSTIDQMVYDGIFGMASVELSFIVRCTASMMDCGNCAHGFTGNECETRINSCVGIVCEGDKLCMDGTCVCAPGSTGVNCSTDVNDCLGVDCSGRGECVDQLNSYTCQCEFPYTGPLCELQISGYELLVTIRSYSNPTNRCAGCMPPNLCCDSNCTTGLCDAYFYLCTRRVMPVTFNTLHSEIGVQGDCTIGPFSTPRQDRNRNNATFMGSDVLGLPNPVIFTSIPSVSNTSYNNYYYVISCTSDWSIDNDTKGSTWHRVPDCV